MHESIIEIELPISVARRRFADVMNAASRGEITYITRRGERVAVILPVEFADVRIGAAPEGDGAA